MIDDDDLEAIEGGEEEVATAEPKSARSWLKSIKDAEKAFSAYQDKCDNIDKLYADLEKLSKTARDREFQIFWANVQVMAPSIYARPPVPVVVPRFKDRRPLYRMTAELLERSTIVGFELEDIDATMRLLRDDLAVAARGAAWCRYEAKSKENDYSERVCIEHVDRKDFLHDPARKWKEVDWVAKRSWLTKGEMRRRFRKASGDLYKEAAYEQRKDENDPKDTRLKAGVWEIWSKSANRVVWVNEGCDKLLDDGDPHLTLEGFFPCPRPAYATLQRRSLVPIPDVLFYKDQLEEINELTARISALTEAVKVRGFYPAGAGEIGDAIEAAVNSVTNNKMLVGISNWAMIGNGGVKDMIVWMPIDMVTTVIQQLVEMRRQLIQDVYEVSGLSDILRGQTDPNETLGAQELKAQTGSTRIKDKQNELARIARDIARIVAEVMSENFQPQTLADMSQLEMKTNADVASEVEPLKAQINQIVTTADRLAPEQVEQAKQMALQIQQQIAQAQEQPTLEKAIGLLREQRVRPFVLDIETDSTIAADENAQKQRATEFITAVGGFMGQALPLVQTVPQSAPLAAEALKFVASQFRAGRMLETAIEEFADQMKAMAQQPTANPEADQAAAEQQAKAADLQLKQQAQAHDAQLKQEAEQANQQREDQKLQADLAARQADDQRKVVEHQVKLSQMDADAQRAAEEHRQKLELGALQVEKLRLEIDGVKVKTAATVATTQASVEATEAKKEAGLAQTAAGIEATRAKAEASNEASA